MKWISIFGLILLLTTLVSAQDEVSMYIQLKYANEEISVEEVGLVEGASTNFDFEDAPYSAVVSSVNGERTKVDFEFPMFVFADDFSNEGGDVGMLELEEGSQLLYFPYYRGVDKLDVRDSENKVVFTYDLSGYRVCDFDNICYGNEDDLSCPEDCVEGASGLDEEVLEEDVEEIPESINDKKKKSPFVAIIAFVVVVGLIVGYVKFQRKREVRKFYKSR